MTIYINITWIDEPLSGQPPRQCGSGEFELFLKKKPHRITHKMEYFNIRMKMLLITLLLWLKMTGNKYFSVILIGKWKSRMIFIPWCLYSYMVAHPNNNDQWLQRISSTSLIFQRFWKDSTIVCFLSLLLWWKMTRKKIVFQSFWSEHGKIALNSYRKISLVHWGLILIPMSDDPCVSRPSVDSPASRKYLSRESPKLCVFPALSEYDG